MTKSGSTIEFKVISVNLPRSYCDVLKLLKKEKIYPSITSIIRLSLRSFFLREIELIKILEAKETLNKIAQIPNFIEFKKELNEFEKYINKKIIKIS